MTALARHHGYFALIADEATGITHNEQLKALWFSGWTPGMKMLLAWFNYLTQRP